MTKWPSPSRHLNVSVAYHFFHELDTLPFTRLDIARDRGVSCSAFAHYVQSMEKVLGEVVQAEQPDSEGETEDEGKVCMDVADSLNACLS